MPAESSNADVNSWIAWELKKKWLLIRFQRRYEE